jgi:hypothetical protein
MTNKISWRKQMAALSFSEKIRILEQLRQRSLAIAASGLRNAGHSSEASGKQKIKP